MTPKRIGLVITLFLAGMAATVVLVFTKRFDAFLAYVVLTLIMITVLVKLVHPSWVKWTVGVVSLVAFWEMGHIDEFLGEREHRELCEKYAGVKIYKKAQLPPEFYNADGTPKFVSLEKGLDQKMLKGLIRIDDKRNENFSIRYVKIDLMPFRIMDDRDGKIFGEVIDFAIWPSPFVPSISHSSAHGCYLYTGRTLKDEYRELYRLVFLKPL